jgi:hypothetical protein
MANTIKTGTILISESALLPESLLIETEPVAEEIVPGAKTAHRIPPLFFP